MGKRPSQTEETTTETEEAFVLRRYRFFRLRSSLYFLSRFSISDFGTDTILRIAVRNLSRAFGPESIGYSGVVIPSLVQPDVA